MRFCVLIFLLLFYSISNFGQVHKGFRWIDPKHYLYSVDLQSGKVFKESPTKIKVELGSIVGWDSLKRELPGDFDIQTFYQQDGVLITVPGTGLLYRLHIPTLQLDRLDETFFRGYNFNASQFIRKDTLFSIGGEGFWQRHSIVTFFNPQTDEWDLYESVNDNKHPTYQNFSGYSTEKDAFFSAYMTTDSVLEGKDVYFNIYSFKQKKWERKGRITDDLMLFARKKFSAVWTGKYLILYSDKNLGRVQILDPFANELFEYASTEDHFFISNCEVYFQDGKLFSRSIISAGKNDKFYFDSLSVKTMLSQSKRLGSVYEPEVPTMAYFITSTLVFSVLAGLLFYRKRRSKLNQFRLSDTELQVVKEFMLHAPDTKISSIELNNLLAINHKSYDNQRQIRNRIIGAINQRLYDYCDAKDFILRSSNSEDKRMMDYFINPELKPKDLEKLNQQILVA